MNPLCAGCCVAVDSYNCLAQEKITAPGIFFSVVFCLFAFAYWWDILYVEITHLNIVQGGGYL